MAAPTLPNTYSAFFYGTLMAPEVLYRVIYGTEKVTDPAKVKTVVPALLVDYCRHKVRYADYPGIIAEAGHTVRGTYVTGLTPNNMMRLDMFEGDDYTREKVTVKILAPKNADNIMGETVETGQVKEAHTYVFIDKNALVKEEWDYEYFRREKLRNWANVDDEYAGSSKVPRIFGDEKEHDPTGGRGFGSAVATQLEEALDASGLESWTATELKRIQA